MNRMVLLLIAVLTLNACSPPQALSDAQVSTVAIGCQQAGMHLRVTTGITGSVATCLETP